MKTFLKLAAIFSLALANGWLYGQSGQGLILNSNAPGTATLFRVAGNCPTTGVPASGTTLSSSIAVTATPITAQAPLGNQGTFNDSTAVAGTPYCYWSTLATTGGGSGVSNTFLGQVTVVFTLSGK